MTSRHAPRYSVTCHSEDEPIVRCLKALADYVERSRPDGRAAGAVLERAAGGLITLWFTHPDYRAAFVTLATDLLGSRFLCAEQDDDQLHAELA